jgi:hypothetical protein
MKTKQKKTETEQVSEMLTPAEVNRWAAEATTTRTTQRHRRLLSVVLSDAKTLTAKAVLRFLTEYKSTHTIKWSTLNTMFGTAIGACRRAHLLIKGCQPIELMADHEFKLARRTVEAKAKVETVNSPTPAQWQQVQSAMKQAIRKKNIAAARLILLSWVTAGRPSCVQKLHGANIVPTATYLGAQAPHVPNMAAYTISFHEGKVVKHTGPYSIHTFIPDEYVWLVLNLPQETFIPEQTLKTFVSFLKAENIQLESRSLRRGSLQTMARHGATDDQLLEYSRHASKGMLYRYLGWGRTRMTGAQLQAPSLFATL